MYGSSNTSSSRFADMCQNTIASSSGMSTPRIVTGFVVVRRNCITGDAHRRISSTALSRMSGLSMRSCFWSGCSSSASIPWLMALRVVSLPATDSSMKKTLKSMSVSRSPSTSACRRALAMSSPGCWRLWAASSWA